MSLMKTGGGWFSGQRRWTLTLIIVLAMLIPAAAAFAAAPGDSGTIPPPTVPGEICVEVTVIDWEEEPLTEGWIVYPTDPNGMQIAGKGPETDDDGDATNKATFDTEDDGLFPGVWTFTIDYGPNVPDGGLVGNWEPVEPYTNSFQIELDAQRDDDDCYQIRFKLREVVEVLVYKIDSHHKLLDGWDIVAKPAHGNYFASEQEGETGDDGTGLVIFRLTPGTWVFHEYQPDDSDTTNDYVPILPSSGSQELVVKSADDDADNQPYVIRFKNKLIETCIEVYKTDEPPAIPDGADPADYYTSPANLAGWEIRVLRTDGSEATFGYTDANGYVKFSDLPPGPYTVVEETRPGWEAVGPDEYDISVVQSEDCTQVNFVNRQIPLAYEIKGRKLDANGHYGIPGWEITIEAVDKQGYDPDPDSVFTDGLGHYTFSLPFDDYRVPGARFRVCEEELDGWLPHTPDCYIIQLPYQPGTVHVPDFVNQQVGHTESGKPNGEYHDDDYYENGCHYHYVRPGESLFGIGSHYGASAQEMLNANSWVRSRPHHYLRPGDKVCIP